MTLSELLKTVIGLHYDDYKCYLDGTRILPKDTMPDKEYTQLLRVGRALYSIDKGYVLTRLCRPFYEGKSVDEIYNNLAYSFKELRHNIRR